MESSTSGLLLWTGPAAAKMKHSPRQKVAAEEKGLAPSSHQNWRRVLQALVPFGTSSKFTFILEQLPPKFSKKDFYQESASFFLLLLGVFFCSQFQSQTSLKGFGICITSHGNWINVWHHGTESQAWFSISKPPVISTLSFPYSWHLNRASLMHTHVHQQQILLLWPCRSFSFTMGSHIWTSKRHWSNMINFQGSKCIFPLGKKAILNPLK